MAARTTINLHLRGEKVEIKADLQYLEPSSYRYWALTVVNTGEFGDQSHLTMFLAPQQVSEMADQLRMIVAQLDRGWHEDLSSDA